MKKRFLVVDDMVKIREQMVKYASKFNLDVDYADSVLKATDKLRGGNKFDGVLLDYSLPDGTCENLIEPILKNNPNTQILVLSGYLNRASIKKLHTLGVTQILAKPITDYTRLDSFLTAVSSGNYIRERI